VASEPGYRRPVVILQADQFNQSRIQTIIAAVVTTNLTLAQAPGTVFLPKKHSRLPKDSVVNLSQIVTLDRSFLDERIGKLPSELVDQIEDGLRCVLSLE